jgi:hypothetical protein
VVAHEFAAVDHLEDARRHIEQRMVVRMARFKKQHATASLDQPRCGHAASSATTYNDVIEFLSHR